MQDIIINGIVEESQEFSGEMRYARGTKGDDGVTFTPSVDANGNISWTNDGGRANPQTRNIKGETGDAGVYIGTTPPTDPDVKVWIDTSGEAGDVEMTINKSSSISSSSTNTQYAGAKAVYDYVEKSIETLETISVGENITEIVRTQYSNGNSYKLSHVRITANFPKQASADASAINLFINNTKVGTWANIRTTANTNIGCFYAHIINGCVYSESIMGLKGVANSIAGSSILVMLNGLGGFKASSITSIKLTSSSGSTIPEGTSITIEGVKR